jgi:hypothetical protein
MTYEEVQVTAAVEELKELARKTIDQDALAALDTIINGFETMRPYVRVGLRVSPSDETLEAMNRVHSDGRLSQELWQTMMKALRLARYRQNPQASQPPVSEPFWPATSPPLGPCRRNAIRHLRPPGARSRLK